MVAVSFRPASLSWRQLRAGFAATHWVLVFSHREVQIPPASCIWSQLLFCFCQGTQQVEELGVVPSLGGRRRGLAMFVAVAAAPHSQLRPADCWLLPTGWPRGVCPADAHPHPYPRVGSQPAHGLQSTIQPESQTVSACRGGRPSWQAGGGLRPQCPHQGPAYPVYPAGPLSQHRRLPENPGMAGPVRSWLSETVLWKLQTPPLA